MFEKKHYTNGQVVYEFDKELLRFFYKNGTVKAEGPFRDGQMDGKWTFYRENGQLWQIGHFKHGQKHGSWIRYNRNQDIEYDEILENDRVIKK